MSETMHEFIGRRRSEILALCVQRMKQSTPGWRDEDLQDGFAQFIDDVVHALEREAGLPVTSPLPGESEAAARHGARRQERGCPIGKVATDFGSLSDVLGQLAGEAGIMFAAREYQVFNQCVDTGIATALDRFWSQAGEQAATSEQERLGFLAHELRNSLASASVAFTILRQGQLSANSRTGDVLDRSLKRLQSLIDHALAAVRLQGPLKLVPQKVALDRFLRELTDAATPERRITLRREVAEGLEVTADEELLQSAVSNLVQNALKFTKPGSVVVLRAREEGASVVIEIEDECGGLPPGNEAELFKPFIQKGGNRLGLGLGLAITKGAVEAHGGELAVQNLPGKGCIFRVKLPRVPEG